MGNNASTASRTPDIPKRRLDTITSQTIPQSPMASTNPTNSANAEYFSAQHLPVNQNYNSTRDQGAERTNSRSISRDARGNPLPHKSMRTKKKSLELPDLADLGITPYNVNTAVQRGRAAQSSARSNLTGYGYYDNGNSPGGSQPIPIPSSAGGASNSGRGEGSAAAFNVDAGVEQDVDHAHRDREHGRSDYSGQSSRSSHHTNGNNNFFRGRPLKHNSTRSFGTHATAVVNRRQQAPPAVQTPEPLTPATTVGPTGYVQETVRSVLPIPLTECSNSDEPLSDAEADVITPGTPGYYALGGQPQPVETRIVWNGGGNVVSLARAGDDEWKGRTIMYRDPPDQTQTYSVTVALLPGTHHIRFVVDDAWKVADDLPKAVDDEGSFANYVAVELGGPSSTTSSSSSAVTASPTQPSSLPVRAAPNGGGMSLAMSTPQQQQQPARQPMQNSFWSTSSSMSVDATAVSRSNPHHHHDDIALGWTRVIPPGLSAAALEEEAYLSATAPAQAPNVPPAPGLPRHLDRLILNVRPSASGASGGTSSGGASGRSSPAGGGSPTGRRERELRGELGESSGRRSSHHSPSGSGSRRDRDRRGSALAPSSMTAAVEEILTTTNATASTATPESTVPVLPLVSPSSVLTSGAATGPVANRVREREKLDGPGLADDASVLPVPSHVVLQHLSTSAIKNGVLAVGCTVRYKTKYLTTIYYKPT